jgi:hypothetical protein
MTRREQELVDQHRAWREQAAATPEQPWLTEPPERELDSREQRLADARARRKDRLGARSTLYEVRFITVHGATLVQGPAPLMEQAWASGEPVRVRGGNGALYKVRLANISKPDGQNLVIGHPSGSLAARNQVAYLARAGKPKDPTSRRVKRRGNGGQRRGARSRR